MPRLALFLAFFSFFAPAAAEVLLGPIPAIVEDVVDGDTNKMRVTIWLGQELSVAIRLAEVDAPELFRPSCVAERELAGRAKIFAVNFLAGSDIALFDVSHGKYAGRAVARIEADGEDLGEALVGAGLASYENVNWCAGA